MTLQIHSEDGWIHNRTEVEVVRVELTKRLLHFPYGIQATSKIKLFPSSSVTQRNKSTSHHQFKRYVVPLTVTLFEHQLAEQTQKRTVMWHGKSLCWLACSNNVNLRYVFVVYGEMEMYTKQTFRDRQAYIKGNNLAGWNSFPFFSFRTVVGSGVIYNSE